MNPKVWFRFSSQSDRRHVAADLAVSTDFRRSRRRVCSGANEVRWDSTTETPWVADTEPGVSVPASRRSGCIPESTASGAWTCGTTHCPKRSPTIASSAPARPDAPRTSRSVRWPVARRTIVPPLAYLATATRHTGPGPSSFPVVQAYEPASETVRPKARNSEDAASDSGRTNSRLHRPGDGSRVARTDQSADSSAPFFLVVRIRTGEPTLDQFPRMSLASQHPSQPLPRNTKGKETPLEGFFRQRIRRPHRTRQTVMLGRLTRQVQHGAQRCLRHEAFQPRTTGTLARAKTFQSFAVEAAKKPAHANRVPREVHRDFAHPLTLRRGPQQLTAARPNSVRRPCTPFDFHTFGFAHRAVV